MEFAFKLTALMAQVKIFDIFGLFWPFLAFFGLFWPLLALLGLLGSSNTKTNFPPKISAEQGISFQTKSICNGTGKCFWPFSAFFVLFFSVLFFCLLLGSRVSGTL